MKHLKEYKMQGLFYIYLPTSLYLNVRKINEINICKSSISSSFKKMENVRNFLLALPLSLAIYARNNK